MAESRQQIDKLMSKVETRRHAAKILKVLEIQTDRGVTQGTPVEVPQSPTARLFLDSVNKTLSDIKSDPMLVDFLPVFAKKSRELRNDVNILDYQHHTNSIDIPIALETGEIQYIRVTTLDLAQPPVGVKDERDPYIGFGGAGSITEQNPGLWWAFALEGKKVQVVSFPEQNQERMVKGRRFIDKFKNTRKLQLESFKKTLQHLGHERMNLIGHSLGAAEIIELAADPEFAGKINDVISLAPVGFEKQNVLSLAKRFWKQGRITKEDPEGKIVMIEQGNVDAAVSSKVGLIAFAGLGRAAAELTITDSVLEGALKNMTGELQVWTGQNDSVSRPSAIHPVIKEFVKKHPRYMNRVASYTINGGYHDFFITNGLGLVSAIDKESENRIKGIPYLDKRIDSETLVRSASEWILSKMKAQSA